MIGTTIGHYTIEEKLGEGGMGVVYKATDTKLDRLVALKFLPEELSRSTSDAARFTQEAKAAAALNHPNICTIHGIEEIDGPATAESPAGKKNFIVMEYVDGQTLGDKKGTVSLKQAIDIGMQIADGLAAAHEKGITHRDIKPDNIMIRKDGITQIMDFGLAKLRGVSNLTQQGSTVGTARYMSPEQVQGEDIDHRSDIFSLGVLLYELFSGQLPFRGVHETALMYEIVHVDPEPMSTVKTDLPPELDAIVLECLAKEKADRYQSAAEIAKELRRFKRESSRQMASRVTRARSIPAMPASQIPAQSQEIRPQTSSLVPWSVAALFFVGAILGFWQPWASAVPAAEVVRFTLKYATDASVDTRVHPQIDISQDGSRIVYRAGSDLFVRDLSSLDAKRLEEVRDGMNPVFSPNGQTIAYFQTEQELMKTPSVGGKPVLISTLDNAAGSRRGLEWTQRGTLLFSAAVGPIMEINESGGDFRELTRIDTSARERTHRWPDVLPNGKALLFTVGTVESPDYYEDATIQAYEFATGERTMVLRNASSAKYVPTGHLVFTRSGALYGIRFDEDKLETVGEPIQLVNGITGDYTSGAMQYALSGNGTLVYVPGGAGAIRQNFVMIDYDGNVKAYPAPDDQYFYPRISPDGKRIALCIGSTREMDVYIYEITRQSMVRFTFGGYNTTPVWSPDGKFIAFSSRQEGSMNSIMIKRADGTGNVQKLWSQSGDYFDITDWSPDGKTLVLDLGYGERDDIQKGLYLLDIEDTDRSRPFVVSKFNQRRASYSPDMKYIAYSSDRTGLNLVFVQSVEDEGGLWQVSASAGWAPRWSPDGKYLYYNDAQSRVIMRVPLLPGPGFRYGDPVPVAQSFRTPSIDPAFFPFDVFPDGSGFLTIVDANEQSKQDIVVVLNWFEELRKAFGESE